MNKAIMVGADVHKVNMLLKVARDRDTSVEMSFTNSRSGRKAMCRYLLKQKEEAKADRIIFAYEASPVGFGLYDELTEIGIESYVLAPTNIARSVKHRRRKTDAADSERILEIVRGHILAGNPIPSIWIPDHQTRDDRELVRTRLDTGKKLIVIKAQIVSLLGRNSYRKPNGTGTNWTKRHRQWLGESMKMDSGLPFGARLALGSLLRQLAALEAEQRVLDRQVEELSRTDRYALTVQELIGLNGVGILTAMVYLTEMGDLSRFANRRDVGAYLGLIPSSFESGEINNRKGHITRHGPSRVRKVLCQASWARVRTDSREKRVYERIVARNPKMKKIAVVASMRRLAIKMWHVGLRAQQEAGVFARAA